MKPDIITYNTQLSGLVALHKVELAFALLDTIVRGCMHPTAATWRILMNGAASTEAHGCCHDAWRNLLRTEAVLDMDDINTAIFALVELVSALAHLPPFMLFRPEKSDSLVVDCKHSCGTQE
jgi:hypothetical protein